MKTIDLIAWAIISLILIVAGLYIVFLISTSDEKNDVRQVPEGYTSPTININTTRDDLIIGQWIRPDDRTIRVDNISIESYGYATKWEKNNDNLTYIRGPWTKVSENSYLVHWLAKGEMFENYGVTESFTPINETIIYDRLKDSINVSGIYYIRNNKTIDTHSNNK
jgi:hypothetical protein